MTDKYIPYTTELRHWPSERVVVAYDDAGDTLARIPITHNEYGAGASIEQPGFVALQTGEGVYYLPPYAALALAESLRWAAKYADEAVKNGR